MCELGVVLKWRYQGPPSLCLGPLFLAYHLLPTQNSQGEASSKSGLNDGRDSGPGRLL